MVALMACTLHFTLQTGVSYTESFKFYTHSYDVGILVLASSSPAVRKKTSRKLENCRPAPSDDRKYTFTAGKKRKNHKTPTQEVFHQLVFKDICQKYITPLTRNKNWGLAWTSESHRNIFAVRFGLDPFSYFCLTKQGLTPPSHVLLIWWQHFETGEGMI